MFRMLMLHAKTKSDFVSYLNHNSDMLIFFFFFIFTSYEIGTEDI